MKKIILSDQKINTLVTEITQRVLRNFPSDKSHIDGSEVAKLAHHKQLNQFMLFQIYQDWNSQVSRVKHPYFDFEHAEVKEALSKFMNTLSRHIRVSKEDCNQMLGKAAYNSLRLILDPETALQKFFFREKDAIPFAYFQSHAPYFSDFDFVIQSIQRYHEKQKLEVVNREDFFEKFKKILEIFESKEGKSVANYQRFLFHKLTGKDLDEIVKGETKAQREIREVASETPPPVVSPPVVNQPQDAPVTEIKADSPADPPVKEEPQTLADRFTENKNLEVPPAVESKKNAPGNPRESEDPQTLAQKIAEGKGMDSIPLHERLAAKRESEKSIVESSLKKENVVVDTPRVEAPVFEQKVEEVPEVEEEAIDLFSSPSEEESTSEVETVANKFQETKKETVVNQHTALRSIKLEHIPIHKQFQFVQKVFGGSSVQFKVMLDKINEIGNADQLNTLLDQEILNQEGVDRNDKITQEFLLLVKSRFQ